MVRSSMSRIVKVPALSAWGRRQPPRWPGLGRRLASAAAILMLLAAPPPAAQAQEEFSRTLQTVPIDPNAPDVVEFKTPKSTDAGVRKSVDPAFEDLPGDQFFATINIQRTIPKSVEEGASPRALAAVAEECPIEMADWDPSNRRGWFQVNYGAPCQLSLYCNWIVDPVLDTTRKAQSLESEIEAARDAADADAPPPDSTPPPEGALDETDTHVTEAFERRKSFVLAGTRQCELVRYCNGNDDALCTDEFLELKASQIEIEQLGK